MTDLNFKVTKELTNLTNDGKTASFWIMGLSSHPVGYLVLEGQDRWNSSEVEQVLPRVHRVQQADEERRGDVERQVADQVNIRKSGSVPRLANRARNQF